MPEPKGKPVEGYRNQQLGARAGDKSGFVRLSGNQDSSLGIYQGFEFYTPPEDSTNEFDREAEIYRFKILGADGIWRDKEWKTSGSFHLNDAAAKAKWPRCSVSDFMACIPPPDELAKMKGIGQGGVVLQVTRFGEKGDKKTDYLIEVMGVPDGFKPVLTLLDNAGNQKFQAPIPVVGKLNRESMMAEYLEKNPEGGDQVPAAEPD